MSKLKAQLDAATKEAAQHETDTQALKSQIEELTKEKEEFTRRIQSIQKTILSQRENIAIQTASKEDKITSEVLRERFNAATDLLVADYRRNKEVELFQYELIPLEATFKMKRIEEKIKELIIRNTIEALAWAERLAKQKIDIDVDLARQFQVPPKIDTKELEDIYRRQEELREEIISKAKGP